MGSADDETLESYGAEVGKWRSSWGRVRDWFLVEADRLFLAVAISVATFLMFLGLGEVGVIAFVNDDSVTRVASGAIAGTFSLVTLVVSINQLILSREFSAAGEARDELEGVSSFREDVADVASVPAGPASPTRFLELLVHAMHVHAGGLAAAVEGHGDEEVESQVSRFANEVETSTDRIDETLERSSFGTFRIVSATISYDESWHLYVARHLRGRYDGELSDEALAELDRLTEALELFDVAREHFKTTYLQRELTRFSQLTIYTGFPAIIAAMLIGLLYADFAGPSVSLVYLPVVVSALLAVIVSPLALLVSFILRTATVTRRTASTGPMVPQKEAESGPFEVEFGDDSDRADPEPDSE